MAAEKYTAATARGEVMDATDLDALADGDVAPIINATEVANQTNLDQFGMIVLTAQFASGVNDGAAIDIFASINPEGGSYEDSPSGSGPVGEHTCVATINPTPGLSGGLFRTPIFRMPGPFPTKFTLRNRTGVAFSTGNSANLMTFNRGT
jgi:hypothetical protein